jgi:phage-related protein
MPLIFYRTRSGAEIVRNWLRELDDPDRRAIGVDLMSVQYRWPVGMPLCRSLSDGLWEVRSSLPSNRIARVLFSVHQDRIVALHGFIKKTRRRQMKTWLWRGSANVNWKIEGGCHGKEEKNGTQHCQVQHA